MLKANRIIFFLLSLLTTNCMHIIPDYTPRKIETEELRIAARSFKGTITAAIPCIPRDINKLSRLLESIDRQTLLPDEVVVSLSETNKWDGQSIEKKLRRQFPNLNIRIFPYAGKAYAAKNRNMAAAASKGEYLSFMDADDVMHPEKIELMVGALVLTGAQMVLHGQTPKLYKNKPLEKKITIIEGKDFYRIAKSQPDTIWVDFHSKASLPGAYSKYQMHIGQPMIQRDLYMKIKQEEGDEFRRSEDSKFLRDVLAYFGEKNNSVTFIELALTEYISAFKQKFP